MEKIKKAKELLGISGKLLSWSKGRYLEDFPDNKVVFNANICTKEDGKIWYGDLDITKERKNLEKLSKELKEDIYIIRELDARFENEDAPKFDKAVEIFKHN